jgi:uncharacterized protein YabE (DUF348 family)
MHKIRAACAVLAFTLLATVVLPLVVYNFTAANEEFPFITVHDSGQTHRYETAAQTVGEFFNHLGIATTDLDRVSYPADAPIYDGMVININRAVEFSVTTDDNPPTHWTVRYGTTVADIMVKVQNQYDTAFIYHYDLDKAITPQENLHFYSWRSRYFTEVLELPFEIYENHTGAVRAGRTHIRQTGIPGQHEVTINVVYIGGEEDSRTLSDAVILSAPVNAIYDIGTAQLGALTNPSAPDFHYLRRVRMQATAYCACFACTGRNPDDRLSGITASGRRVEHGIVAVDRTVIPFGHPFICG